MESWGGGRGTLRSKIEDSRSLFPRGGGVLDLCVLRVSAQLSCQELALTRAGPHHKAQGQGIVWVGFVFAWTSALSSPLLTTSVK